MTDKAGKQAARERIARILKPARKARGLTIKEVIKDIELRFSQYSGMEHGRSYCVTPEIVTALADRLGLDSKELLALAKPLFPQPRKTRKRKPVTTWDKIVDEAGRQHGLMRARALWGRAEMKSFHLGVLRIDFQDETLAYSGAGHVSQIKEAAEAGRVVISLHGREILDTLKGNAAKRKGDAGHLNALRQYGPAHGFGTLTPPA